MDWLCLVQNKEVFNFRPYYICYTGSMEEVGFWAAFRFNDAFHLLLMGMNAIHLPMLTTPPSLHTSSFVCRVRLKTSWFGKPSIKRNSLAGICQIWKAAAMPTYGCCCLTQRVRLQREHWSFCFIYRRFHMGSFANQPIFFWLSLLLFEHKP